MHDGLCHHRESFIDVDCVLRRCFDVRNVHAVGELGRSGLFDDSAVNEVDFIANEQLVDVLARIAVNFAEPLLDVRERLRLSAVEHKDDALRTAVIRRGDSAETFLTGSIPLASRRKKKKGGEGHVC